MNKIKVIDARMGRGKTSAAMRYMEENKETKRFLYITPYLEETERICKLCEFNVETPGNGDVGRFDPNEYISKLECLKKLLRSGKNVATTHALFHLLDEKALEIIREKGYSLIVDEELQVVESFAYPKTDLEIATRANLIRQDGSRLMWIDDSYDGEAFYWLKRTLQSKEVHYDGERGMSLMNPTLLEAFSDVILMTYLFECQYQRIYLDMHGFEYEICGIDDSEGYRFSDKPDDPPEFDYSSLIKIIEEKYLNEIGEKNTLSLRWYDQPQNATSIDQMRKNMNTFMSRQDKNMPDGKMWTCYIKHKQKLYGDRNRYSTSFVPINARATNKFRECGRLAYMVGRYANPFTTRFFEKMGFNIDQNKIALSEMLQWIWRSRIRDNKEIVVYIPSKRMRNLLKGWIEDVSKGGDAE